MNPYLRQLRGNQGDNSLYGRRLSRSDGRSRQLERAETFGVIQRRHALGFGSRVAEQTQAVAAPIVDTLKDAVDDVTRPARLTAAVVRFGRGYGSTLAGLATVNPRAAFNGVRRQIGGVADFIRSLGG